MKVLFALLALLLVVVACTSAPTQRYAAPTAPIAPPTAAPETANPSDANLQTADDSFKQLDTAIAALS